VLLLVPALVVSSAPDSLRADGGAVLRIEPGDDAAAIVAGALPGTTFVFAPGQHRSATLVPQDGDRFVGEGGAVLSGAVPVGPFAATAEGWVAPLPPPAALSGPLPANPTGVCQPAFPACGHPEELFVEAEPFQRVLDRADLGPGRWLLDGSGRRLLLGEDPAGRPVELSVHGAAIHGSAADVGVAGLRFERYANPAGVGVVHMAEGAQRWLIEECEVGASHGVGVVVRDGGVLRDCWIDGMGQQGVGGTGAGVVVEGNVITRSNRLGFDPGWSAGGAKFAVTSGLRVRRNVVLASGGPGLWTDIDCVDTRYEGNWVAYNDGAGILHEISQSAVISGNVVRGNGASSPGWVWGAGIQIVNSADVTVTGNDVEANTHAIVGIDQVRDEGPYGRRELRALVVTRNRIVDSGQTGIAQDHGDVTVYERGHRFQANRYWGKVSWSWRDAERSWAEWRGVGHDSAGGFTAPPG
jgi:hypothetical protein